MKIADQSGLREGMVMTIGILPLASNLTARTGSIPPLDFRHTIGKCIRGHPIYGSTVYAVTSDFSSTAQVRKVGDIGLYPLPTKDDLGRVDYAARDGNITELSFEVYGEDSSAL